jgi:hypothetical protein
MTVCNQGSDLRAATAFVRTTDVAYVPDSILMAVDGKAKLSL